MAKISVLVFIITIIPQVLCAKEETAIQAAKRAIRHKDVKTLNQLLDSGAVGPNDHITKNYSLLNYALNQSYHSALMPWQADQEPDDILLVVQTLLNHHANPNEMSLNKDIFARHLETSLATAVFWHRFQTAMVLLADQETDVNEVLCDVDRHGNKKPVGTILDFVAGDDFVAALKARGAKHLDPSTMKCN